MTTAAIYARKSTEQKGRAEEDKSVARQVENARAFASQRGWHVPESLVFIDDGISGAEFERRPAFMNMMAARKQFQVLIVSERKSIGREMTQTSEAIRELAAARVEVFEYMHGRSLTPKDHREKLIASVEGFADEDHIRKTSERTKEAHERIVEQGRVVGGRVFGYRNEHVYNGVDAHGNPLRSHTIRVINEPEAAVVRRIFELYDTGLGLKAIAKKLTRDGALAPKPFQRKNADTDLHCPRPNHRWAPSTVRSVLGREVYRGVVVWNKTKKRDETTLKVERSRQRRQRPESDWKRVAAEHLRIVSDTLWTRVAARRAEVEGDAVRFTSGRLCGGPPKRDTRNLLAGIATCAVCGGGLVVNLAAQTWSRAGICLSSSAAQRDVRQRAAPACRGHE